MDEEPVGLGGLIAGQQPSAGGGWTSLLQDPVARSALLSFGLQSMTGGWGNGTQQLAAAMGAGAQGAEGTSKAIQAQALNNRDFQAKQEDQIANRASHEKIAQTSQASREEVGRIRNEGTLAVAQERVAGMLERARLIHGPQNDKEMQIFAKARTDYMKKEKDNQLISKKTDQQILEESDAFAKEQLRGAREAVGVRSQGSALPNEPAAAKPAASASTDNKRTLDQILSDTKLGPIAKQDMRTPEGRTRIQSKFPHISQQEIDQYAKNNYLY